MAAFEKGQRVRARDRCGVWYDARIVTFDHPEQPAEVKVHYLGWNSSTDEWIALADERILKEFDELPDEKPYSWDMEEGLVDLEDMQYEVERIMRKKSTRDGDVKYLIRWKGYSSAYDSWEAAEDVSEEAIEEFDDAKLNGPAKEPYVVTIADSIIAPNVADGLVSEWLDDVARKAAGLLSRQREEWACRKLFQMSPCPSWVFCALHRACTAHEASGAGAVSAIYSVKGGRGGKFVEDQFDMVSTDLVSALVGKYNSKGHGALVVRDNKTAVMLVPPLEFKFRARRQADADGRAWPTELIVTGHFMCLVDRPNAKCPRWAFDDERAEYTPENKLAYKMAVAAAVKELGPAAVKLPARVTKFLSILM